MSEEILLGRGLTRRFGGVIAVNKVDLGLKVGEVHAVIGPNGAGKSTLINLLSGDLSPSAGVVSLRGQDISGWGADRRSRAGIGRSYQQTNIFLDFTAFENCRLAAQSRTPRALHVLRPAMSFADTNARALEALSRVGLTPRERVIAAALSHGEQRQLEIAMLLATEPQVLLLDEPLAGMGLDEAQQIIALIKRLASDHAVLLVEHDMDAVFAVADVLTVMVDGEILASGAPQAIRANAQVQSAYLGMDEPTRH